MDVYSPEPPYFQRRVLISKSVYLFPLDPIVFLEYQFLCYSLSSFVHFLLITKWV